MNTPQNKSSSLASAIRYVSRILCILAILFISIFALDAFSPGLSLWRQIAGFLMHMIPSFVLIIVLIIAWKHELTGGILLVLIGLAASPFVYNINYNRLHSVWKSVEAIAIMTVPCCTGLDRMVRQAVEVSGVELDVKKVVIGIDGQVVQAG
jgi:hypothetical protein